MDDRGIVFVPPLECPLDSRVRGNDCEWGMGWGGRWGAIRGMYSFLCWYVLWIPAFAGMTEEKSAGQNEN